MASSIETRPDRCENGHQLGPGRMLVGWLPCGCAPPAIGHRTVTCRECDAVWYWPPHEPGPAGPWPND